MDAKFMQDLKDSLTQKGVKIIGKDLCPLCLKPFGKYATYPYNRQGNFEVWHHVVCMEIAANWFRKNGWKIDWNTLRVIKKEPC